MSDYIIRAADKSDARELAVLRGAFLCDGKDVPEHERETLVQNNEKYMLEGFSDGSFFAMVAEKGGKIAATSGLIVYRLMPNRGCVSGVTGYIANMFTLPEHRKQGLATRLFAMTVQEAKRRGCERLVLTATAMGRPIYEKYGFTPNEGAMWLTIR